MWPRITEKSLDMSDTPSSQPPPDTIMQVGNPHERHLRSTSQDENHHQFRTKKSTCGRTPYFAHTPLKRHPSIRNPTARDPLPSKAHIGSSPAQCTFRDLSSALTQASQSSFHHPALSFPAIPPAPFHFILGQMFQWILSSPH